MGTPYHHHLKQAATLHRCTQSTGCSHFPLPFLPTSFPFFFHHLLILISCTVYSSAYYSPPPPLILLELRSSKTCFDLSTVSPLFPVKNTLSHSLTHLYIVHFNCKTKRINI